MNIHVKRPVRDLSVGQLAFRSRARRAFSNERISTHSSRYLHSTVATDSERPDAALSIDDLALIVRYQPELSGEPFTANVQDVKVFGRSTRSDCLSIGLALEDNEHFQADQEYYARLIGRQSVKQYRPHVTLLKLNSPTPETTRQLIDWVSDRAPTAVQLGHVSIALSKRKYQKVA